MKHGMKLLIHFQTSRCKWPWWHDTQTITICGHVTQHRPNHRLILSKCCSFDSTVWLQNMAHQTFPGLEGQRLQWQSNRFSHFAWWRHQMAIFSALLALYAGNSPITGEFPSQRPVTRSFDVFFDLRLINLGDTDRAARVLFVQHAREQGEWCSSQNPSVARVLT